MCKAFPHFCEEDCWCEEACTCDPPSTEVTVSVRLLSRVEILEADDTSYEIIETPEWGQGSGVRVRSLTAFEKDHLESAMVEVRKNKAHIDAKGFLRNFRAKLVAMGAVDENGDAIFSELDVARLGQKNAAPVSRLSEAIQRLSAMTKEDVDEMVGNSESDQSDDSPTA
jgi:hypothetical protein